MSLFQLLNPYHLTDAVRKKDALAIQREIILQFLLIMVSVWSVIGLTLYLLRAGVGANNLSLALPFIITIAILVILTIARKLPYSLRAGGLALLILVEMLEVVFRQGVNGYGMIYGIGFVAIVAVLFGPRPGILSIAAVIAIHVGAGWAMNTGRMPLPGLETVNNAADPSSWISSGLALLIVATSIAGAIFQLTRGLSVALEDQKKLTSELVKERDLLENRVTERTQELAHTTARLEAGRQVAGAIAKETEMEKLLTATAEVIKEQFGFYHAGIFLNDPENQYTNLVASTGEAGANMLANGHRLLIGEVGIVGFVAARGKPRVTADVRADPTYFSNPLLPETRSEMAVPLRNGETVIGVLDVQSTQPGAFTPEDVEVIVSIANQLSLALDKARLLQQVQTSLTELETTTREITTKAWNAHLQSTQKRYAFQYKHARIQPSLGVDTPQSRAAFDNGETIVISTASGEQPETVIAVPIKLRNQPLGVVNLRVAASKASPELVGLIENAVNRLSISLENVRLLEELQTRAERERLVGEIGAKVRSATDVESILRTAASELGRSLGVSEVVVQLNTGK